MQIILISDRLAKTRSVSLSLRHLIGTALFALVLVCGATAGLYWLTLRYASEVRVPALQRLVLAAQEAEAERGRTFVQQNLNAMVGVCAVHFMELRSEPWNLLLACAIVQLVKRSFQ